MEERTLLSTFVVNTVSDLDVASGLPAGQESLRQAIEDVNADPNPGTDTIDFNIPGSGVQVIQPLSQLPVITHSAVIDGYSQPGSSPNSLVAGDNAVLLIQLDGSQAGGSFGLGISAGNSEVMGLVVSNFESYGIFLTGTGGNVIEGNFLGTDPTGQLAEGNSEGVTIQCNGNRIGTDGSGSTDIPGGTSGYADRNLVSGNDGSGIAYGIAVGGNNNVVAGNFVGTDATGTKPLGNVQTGVFVAGYQNRIGADGHDADPSAERNIISGNTEVGVGLQGGGQNVVAGNFIGTDVTGTQPLGNGYIGVDLYDSDGNLIGTDGDGVGDAAERNIISANQGDGVDVGIGSDNNVVAGNYIGTDVTGTQPLGNSRAGINVNYGSSFNRIGTDGQSVDNVGEANVISCNGGQIDLGSGAPGQDNLVAGNFVGTDVNGNPIPGATTGSGIDVEGDSNDQIGGSPTLANTIANNLHGVVVSGASTGVSIRANRIFDNGPGLGIDLGGDGVTLNNSHAGQPGPNNWQNFPVLSTAVAGSATRVIGTLNSTPNSTFTLDFYANDPDVAQYYGPGRYYLGSATVTTDGSGNVSFNVGGLAATTPGEWVSATATDPGGNTSEFAFDVEAVKVDSTTTLTPSADPSVYGQAVTFTATSAAVDPEDGTPTGSVQFLVDGSNFGAPVALVDGSATSAAIDSLGAGNHTVAAVYSGDTSFNVSTAEITETVAPVPLAIAADGQTMVYGAALPVLTASYSGFVNGDTPSSLTTPPTLTTTATAASPAGSYAITVTGAVDPNYTISYGDGTLTIVPDTTTTAVTASTNPSNVGQALTLTATVTANPPGSGTPTGSVDFFDTTTNTDLGSVAVSSGIAALTTSSLPLGNQTITASYSGDGNFLTSTGTVTITIDQSIIVLDPSAGGALSLSGNASINIPGGVFVDSSSSSALSASGNAQVKASVIDVHGKVQKSGNASFSPAPVTGAATVADPLALLASPSTSSLTNYGSESLSGNSSATIKPGIYRGITVSGNASLTLSSGTYIIEGGGFSISGNAGVKGSGVLIVNAGSDYPSTGGTYGSITLSGNGSYNLSPPTTGTYAGIVIFQTRDNSKAMTISGNASGMTGTIYAPAAPLSESGNAQLNAAFIVDTMTVSGNGVANIVTLDSPSGAVAYSPAQIRDAYGINALAQDGTGQTIAIVDAYDDPSVDQALDAFDSQFSLTDSGPTLYAQYGPASSFLTVLNQYGQATSLPGTDPNGPGTDNWEVEEALDVEWTHAIAPGAQIILVEANSQSLSDLMAGVATAAAQPGVSVVSMSWGFPEGQAVFASDEATYDSVFNVPGVTFVASTGDYGAADPEYPAYSPNVVSVGGTSLTLNADNSYNDETGWGYESNAVGAFIGSGGGISLYEPEPAYQQGVQSTGSRTTPDVSLVADPATGAWIADPYNLDPSDPFEIVGGTSLSAPAWAGLVALVNQGRVAAGESTLNSADPTETQQALYDLPQNDYHVISSGNNGYNATSSYNLVTGLGTPVANLLVPDLVAYQGPGTSYSGPTVGPLQDANLVNTGSGASGPIDVFSVFDAFTLTSKRLGSGQGLGLGIALDSSTTKLSTLGLNLPEHQNLAGFRPLTPSIINPVTPNTGSEAAVGAGGLMPIDNTPARDVVLTVWSRFGAGASRRMTIPRSNLTRTFAVASGPRISVLNAKLVDSVLSEIGSSRFLWK
ncbi:MAG: Ig-like domain repeat protein [Isosphaeraceae bacterium]